MIKIVHIAKPIGGVGVYIKSLAEKLEKAEFANYVLCNTKDDNIDLYNSNHEKIALFHIDINREINLVKDFKCFNQIIENLKDIKPDIVHCHSAKAGILGRLATSYLKIPCVYTPHAFSYLSAESSAKRAFFKAIEKSFKYSSSKVLACSKSEYYRAVDDLGFPVEKVLLWENSLALSKEVYDSNKIQELPKKYICTIGRPSYQKNTELLIESINEVKKSISNIHLVILGVGLFSPSLQKVKSLIQQYSLTQNVTLVEWISREETLVILEKSLFFVSSSRYEGLSYAGLEALMLSKAGVLTNVDGNKDLIDNNVNGFLVGENITELANSIVNLYENEDLLNSMSLASKQKFENEFCLNKNILKLKQIYKSLVIEK